MLLHHAVHQILRSSLGGLAGGWIPQCNVASQEYLGSYIADEAGRLVFWEGALVTALRRGHWVVLDELNLAPSEVLEALNRRGFVPTDNRSVFSPVLACCMFRRVILGKAISTWHAAPNDDDACQ